MILRSNIPRLQKITRPLERVLDVGGWHDPFNLATHVIDIATYATRLKPNALDPEDTERFTEQSWAVADICLGDWPWPDKYFDFSICSHTLEDVRDPLAVCAELLRVSRRGYIEVPSRLREIFCKTRFAALRALGGGAAEIGFHHHRWFCEIEGDHIRFLPKTILVAENSDFYITRAALGRKLTEAESGIALFWDDSFTFEETFETGAEELRRFRRAALARLKNR